jgi:hypothetical protein
VRRWLLKLFPHLAVSLADSEAARLRSEDRCAFLEGEVQWMRDRVDASHREEMLAVKALANFGMQTAYGVVPYPDAAKLPDRGAEVDGLKMNPDDGEDATVAALHRFKMQELRRAKDEGIWSDDPDAAARLAEMIGEVN